MKNSNLALLLLLSHFCLVISPLWASTKIVKISTMVDYPPFAFQKSIEESIINEVIPIAHDSSILQGYSWDVVRESFHSQGYVIHLTIAPWARAKMYMESHDSDLLFPAIHTKQRAQKYLYSQQAIHSIDLVIYVPQTSDIKWQGLTSIQGLDIAIIRGFSAGSKWYSQSMANEYPVSSIRQAFGMMDRGRVAGYVTNGVVTDHYLKQNNLQEKYRKLPAFDVVDEYMVGMKDNPSVSALIIDFDLGKQHIRKNEVLSEIKLRWGID